MSESNKEKFNDLIAQIMSTLIDACPTPRRLGAEDFGLTLAVLLNRRSKRPCSLADSFVVRALAAPPQHYLATTQVACGYPVLD